MKQRAKRLLNDLDQEIRDHIELATQENIERGMTPEDARYAALRKFGNVTRAKENAREVWSMVWLEQLVQDVRFSLRQLRKSPVFTAVAILTLALGIGVNTALFSMVNGISLRTLPYRNPQQLYAINENEPQLTTQSPWGPWFPVNSANFLLWQNHCPAISSMDLVEAVTFNMTGHGMPRQ
jgi:putative ABC transport system permease protein